MFIEMFIDRQNYFFMKLKSLFNLNHFAQSSKMATATKGFDAIWPFLVFDFRKRWSSGLSARVPESQKL